VLIALTAAVPESWGDRKWLPASMSDGVIEVVAVRGSFELARVKLGVARGLRLAQGRCIHLQVARSKG